MAKRIVETLEVVDIDQQDCHRGLPLKGFPEVGVKAAAVRKLSQAIRSSQLG
ncbi:MAG: hypothetical protein JHD07_24600 [Bradyrhizobium sp.]|nr:hypothetical protein [Bradyrhizobium sp.]